MVHAVIMVETGASKSTEVLDRVLAMDRVIEGHVVAGEYDIIVEVEGDEVYDLLEAVSTDIQSIQGVSDTRTYVSLD
jgi:DNA-binding Lrp family transcriptional regulator